MAVLFVGFVFLTSWIEAERCGIVCVAGNRPSESVLASGGKFTPQGWGGSKGDRLEWNVSLERSISHPWLAVRYAFGARRFGRPSRRELQVTVDGKEVGVVGVPDTGSWQSFRVTGLPLPRLASGSHVLRIQSQGDDSNTDVDCMGLFDDKPTNPPSPFVPTVVARSGHFVYRRTPNAPLLEADQVLREFDRIYGEMDRYGGWTPAAPVPITAVEDDRWPDPRWAAYSNGDGLFLRASVMAHDQGNWCHEMTHLMFQGRIPKWLDESLVHVLTKQVWVPRLYPDLPERAGYRDEPERAARAFPLGPYESVQGVLNLLVARFGPDVFGRFFRTCNDAAKRGELELRPERPMTTAETMKYLSLAAGEDVAPYFRRWSGFSKVGD